MSVHRACSILFVPATSLRLLALQQVEKLDQKQTEYAITMLEQQLHDMKPNMRAIQDYRKVRSSALFLAVLKFCSRFSVQTQVVVCEC